MLVNYKIKSQTPMRISQCEGPCIEDAGTVKNVTFSGGREMDLSTGSVRCTAA
jgi:hypothetical protein